MLSHGVEITGRGVVSSLGLDISTFEKSILAGESAIKPLPASFSSGLRFSTGAPVSEFTPESYFDQRALNTLDRFAQFATVAARQAWQESGLASAKTPPERIAVITGTANAGIDVLELGFKRIFIENKSPLPLTIPMNMASSPASRIAREIGARGPVFTVSSACASSGQAVALALLLLQSGIVDVAVAGGSDSCYSLGYLKAWDSLRVVSSDICRPFSKDRRGITIGEGAGIIVMERTGRAVSRGTKVRGRLLGAAMSSDAGDIILPDPAGMIQAMQGAIESAGLDPRHIGYINAHGTGTIANDKFESLAIRKTFGGHCDSLPVTSSKSALGHAMGASGALELLVTLAALNAQIVPPTLNFTEPDPECCLDVVPNIPRAAQFEFALSNSFAFGGLNVSLALGREDSGI